MGAKDVQSSRKDLEDYSFLEWLDQYTRPIKSKSNLEDDISSPSSNRSYTDSFEHESNIDSSTSEKEDSDEEEPRQDPENHPAEKKVRKNF